MITLIGVALMCLSALGTLLCAVILFRKAVPGAATTAAGFYIFNSAIAVVPQVALVYARTDTAVAQIIMFQLTLLITYPILLSVFVLIYTGRMERLGIHRLYLLIIGPLLAGLAYVWVEARPAHFDMSVMFRTPWGYSAVDPPAYFFVAIAFSLVYFSVAEWLLWRHSRTTTDRLVKTQARLLMLAFAVPSIGAVIGQAVLPTFDVHIIPVAPFMTTISIGLMVFAVIKYGLFTIDIGDLSRNAVALMPSGAVAVDQTGLIVFANRTAETMVDSLPGGLLGGPLTQLFSEGAVQSIWDKYMTSSAGRASDEAFEAHVHSQGRPLAVNVYGSRFFDHASKSELTVIVFSSVAQIKQLQTKLRREKTLIEQLVSQRTSEIETEKRRFEASIDSLPLGFMLLGRRNEVLATNPSLERLAGVPHGGLASRRQVPATNQLLSAVLADSARTLSTSQPADVSQLEFEGRFYRSYVVPMRPASGAPEGAVALLTDITEAKLLDRAKDEFFSIASHELRTPLTAIRGDTSMIKDYFASALKDPNLREMIDDIHDSAVRLIDIVNSFLEVSRLEQDRLIFKLTEVNIARVLSQVQAELSPEAQAKKLSLNLELGSQVLPLVRADEVRVKQIAGHIISNAIRYTDSGSITVSAEVSGDYVAISVRDTGRGIDPANQKLLFRKLQQAGDSILTRDSSRGVGLSLYISKLLCQKMGGSIALEDTQVGQGSTFTFTLPRA